MDITTLSLAKKYANKVAAGITAARVEGSSIILTLTDGTEAICQLPTPKDGISVIDLSIDTDGSLLCHMSDGSTIDAGKVPTIDPDLTNYYTKNEIDKNNYLTVANKVYFNEPDQDFDTYYYSIFDLSTDSVSFDDFIRKPYNNNESLEIIWDGTSYNCECNYGNWGDLENTPFKISLGSERVFTNDTSPYHTILIKDIRGNILGNKIPREYIDLSTNPIKTSELDNDNGFLSIEKLKFTKDSSNSKNIYYYSISGYESFFNEAGHDPLDVIWDGVSYHVSFDEAGVRWGNYNYEPFDISPMSNRIETLDTSEYHTVIIKNSKGNILFGNSTLEEYIDIKLPTVKPQIIVDNITEASIMMSDNTNIQLSKPVTQLFLEYPEVIEIGYHSEITFTMDKTEMSFHPDWGYDGEIKWYGQYVDKYGTPYISRGSTYHIVFTYNVNGMKAVINGDEILNETELTKNKVSTITEESKNNEYPNVNAVKNYVNNAISTSIGNISTILSTLTTVSEVSK